MYYNYSSAIKLINEKENKMIKYNDDFEYGVNGFGIKFEDAEQYSNEMIKRFAGWKLLDKQENKNEKEFHQYK